MATRLRVFLVGRARADLDALRARAAADSSLDVVGSALKREVDQASVRVPQDVDAVLMSLAALAPAPSSREAEPERFDLVETLTSRELDVLALVADGCGNREIATRLAISEHTVKFHLSSIFGKLGASTRTEAVRRGLERGLIEI